MKVVVLTKEANYRYEDGKDNRVLIDINDGKLLIQRQYNKNIERVILFDKGTWDKVNIARA